MPTQTNEGFSRLHNHGLLITSFSYICIFSYFDYVNECIVFLLIIHGLGSFEVHFQFNKLRKVFNSPPKECLSQRVRALEVVLDECLSAK